MQSLCVFCGSSSGTNPRWKLAAEAMGAELARRRWRLVYGGGRVGLMGALADAVLAGGGEVIGVIPQRLAIREVAHAGLTQMHVVATMHERKALMAELSDGFVALPGGYGTFEEFFEIVTWAQLGIHARPIGLLDVDGFFAPLLGLVDHAIAAGFIAPEQRRLFVVDSEPPALLDRLPRHVMPQQPKWLDLEQS